MAQQTMYEGIANSPEMEVAILLTDSGTSLTLNGVAGLLAAPNRLTLGDGADAETCMYSAIVGNVVTIARSGTGHEGTAREWPAETVVKRAFCNVDYKLLKENIEDLETRKLAKAPTVVTVGASQCDYTSLTAALAAITDASASKEYCIELMGDVTDTSAVTWKSYVHLNGHGATWTLNLSTNSHGVTFSNLVSARISNLKIVRSGTVTAGGYSVVLVSGTTDDPVIFDNVTMENQLTGYTSFLGIYTSGSCSPRFTNCKFIGAGTSTANAADIINTSSPTFVNCRFTAGSLGASSSGIILESTGSPALINCSCYGGGGGNNSYGIYLAGGDTNARISGCTGVGGGAGTGCHGLFVSTGSINTTIIGCLFVGGSGNTGCHGVSIPCFGALEFTGCEFVPGIGGTGCYGIYVAGAASPIFVGCQTRTKRIQNTLSYTGSTYSLVPLAGAPCFVDSVYLNISVAGGTGSTISIGTTDGGMEIGSCSAAATGNLWITVTRAALAAGGTIYLKPSDTSVRFTAYVIVGYNYGTNYAVYLDTTGPARFTGCKLGTNMASSAVYLTTVALTAGKYMIENCGIETRGTSGVYGVEGQTAVATEARVRQCNIIGGTNNVSVTDTGLIEYGGGAA